MHELDTALEPAALVATLDPAVRRLIATCRVLYSGEWDDLAEDFRRRQAGRPYLFRLQDEPADVLDWVRRLKVYEQVRGEVIAAELVEEEAR